MKRSVAKSSLGAMALALAVGAGALSPSAAHAQGIAVHENLKIPDLPCMTPEERRSLQELANEELVTWRQSQNVRQQMDALLDNFWKYKEAQSVIRKFQLKGGDAAGYNAALETAARLKDDFRRYERLSDAWPALDKKARDLRAKFKLKIAAIKLRKCMQDAGYTPPTIDLVPDISPGPLEPMGLPPSPETAMRVDGHFGGFVGASVPEWSVDWRPSFAFGLDALPLARHSRFTFDEASFTGGFEVGADVHCANLLCRPSLLAVPPHFVGAAFDMAFNADGSPRRDAVFVSPFGGAFPTRQGARTDYTSTMRAVFGFENTFLDGLTRSGPGGPPFQLAIKPYATAGFAFGQVSVDDSIFYGGPFFNAGAWSGVKTGWTAGGGVRFGVGSLGDVQIQYLHIDLGSIDNVASHSAVPLASIQTRHEIMEDRITAGFNVNLRAIGLE